MKLLAEERFKRLAEKNGWTMARAQGFMEGSAARARGGKPSAYAGVGTDDYCTGYREGYFGRPGSSLPSSAPVRGEEPSVGS